MKLNRFAIFLSATILIACSGQEKTAVLEIGFGKADLTQAGYTDPIRP